jgi:hypothetical protein
VTLLETSPNPTAEEITHAFDSYESKQRPRAERATLVSGYQMRLEAQANWAYRFVARWVMPYLPDWLLATTMIRAVIVGSPCMTFLRKPADILPKQ